MFRWGCRSLQCFGFFPGPDNYLFSFRLCLGNNSFPFITGDCFSRTEHNCFGWCSFHNRPGQEFRPADNFRQSTFPLNGHDVNTGYPFYVPDLVDDINRDIHALIFLVLGIFHALDDIIGNLEARYEFFHVACHAKRTRWGNSGKYISFFMQAEITAHLHELFKSIYIIYQLGLDEIGTGCNLFGKPRGPVFIWKCKGIGSSPEKKPRLAALDLLAALKFLGVPHIPHHSQELNGVHVKNTLGSRMIAEFLVISRQAE